MSGAQGDLAVAQPDRQAAVEHEEELVGVGVAVPDELALDLDDLDLVVVKGRDHLGGPVVADVGQPVLEVDDACHGPTLRGRRAPSEFVREGLDVGGND